MSAPTADPGQHAMELAGLTAELVLKKTGTLLPFAVGITAGTKRKTYVMQGQASEQDFEQQVVQAVKADVQAGLLSAVAFAAPVSVTHPTTGRMVDAICIQVETPTQNPVVAFRA